MVTATLDRMAAGGIYDQLGGGFHRYSVDARWLVPHFEKMLYDNALLAACYLEAWQATGKAAVRRGRPADARLPAPRHDRIRWAASTAAKTPTARAKRASSISGRPVRSRPPWARTPPGLFCRVYDVTEAGNFEGRNILTSVAPAGNRG